MSPVERVRFLKSPLFPIYKGMNALYWPSHINHHLVTPHTDSVPPSTNYWYPLLTQHTASSPRNAQFSQLDLVVSSFIQSSAYHYSKLDQFLQYENNLLLIDIICIVISTKGALRIHMTYDNQSHTIPSIPSPHDKKTEWLKDRESVSWGLIGKDEWHYKWGFKN